MSPSKGTEIAYSGYEKYKESEDVIAARKFGQKIIDKYISLNVSVESAAIVGLGFAFSRYPSSAFTKFGAAFIMSDLVHNSVNNVYYQKFMPKLSPKAQQALQRIRVSNRVYIPFYVAVWSSIVWMGCDLFGENGKLRETNSTK